MYVFKLYMALVDLQKIIGSEVRCGNLYKRVLVQ